MVGISVLLKRREVSRSVLSWYNSAPHKLVEILVIDLSLVSFIIDCGNRVKPTATAFGNPNDWEVQKGALKRKKKALCVG